MRSLCRVRPIYGDGSANRKIGVSRGDDGAVLGVLGSKNLRTVYVNAIGLIAQKLEVRDP